MNEEKDFETPFEKRQPWWLRGILAIVSKEGVERLIAIVFIVAVVYVGWRLLGIFEIAAERHFEFLSFNSKQMELQTKTLEELVNSSLRQEQTQNRTAILFEKEHQERRNEHIKIMEKLK